MSKGRIDFDALNRSLLTSAESHLSQWLPGGKRVGREFVCGSIAGESGKSLSINMDTGVGADFATGQRFGDLIDLYAAIRGIPIKEAVEALGGSVRATTSPSQPAASKPTYCLVPPPLEAEAPTILGKHWTYRAGDGRVLFYVERVDGPDGKSFRPWSWDSSRGWVNKMWPAPRPLYGLERLTRLPAARVLITEGEKACDAAQRLVGDRYACVTWAGGAMAVGKSDWSSLAGRTILLWPDNDEPGTLAMANVGQALSKICPVARALTVVDLEPGSDAADINWDWPKFQEWATAHNYLIWDEKTASIEEPQPKEKPKPKAMPKALPKPAAKPHSEEDYQQFDKFVDQAAQWPGEFGFYEMVECPTKNDPDKVRFVPMYDELAQWCFDNRTICVTDKEQLKFDGKKWDWLEKTELGNMLRNWNKGYLQPAHHDNFVKQIRMACYQKALGIDPEKAHGHLNVENGIVNITSGELLPHDYRMRFRYCSPIVYDPTAECPRWERFLLDTFESNIELIDLAQRLFGYVLIGGRPFLHKAFVLYGSGRNGKSTFLDVLRSVLGRDAYSSVSMGKLDKEFSLVNLEGKLANIREETPNEAINAEEFKTLVGGGETTVAHKGFDEYQLRVDARFVFACNDMPIFKDKSVGLEERLIFMPFTRYIPESERDTKILDKLFAELPGILNWALEGAKMMAEQRMIPKYEVLGVSKEAYKVETNPVYAWYKEELEVVKDGILMHTDELYKRYASDMKQCGNTAFGRDRFMKMIRKFISDDCSTRGVYYNKALRDGSGGRRAVNVLRFVHDRMVQTSLPVSSTSYFDRD